MIIQKASRKRARIRLAIQGPSGSGKTYGSLLVAYGLCSDFSKVCVIDTENSSAELYAHLGDYNTIQLAAPFPPEKFIDAIHTCEEAGMEVIIIDSASHEWDGMGGILDIHSNIPGNSFTAWAKVTPRHNAFVQCILNCNCHVITTVRSKQDYVLSEKNGRQVPEKVGLKGIQKDGYEYESTVVFEVNLHHKANVSKDRTELFIGEHEITLNESIGERLRNWCAEGRAVTVDEVSQRIADCMSINDLLHLYRIFPQYKEVLKADFEQRKRQIIINQQIQTDLTKPETLSSNGVH
jgi:hypothetical protein